MTIKKFLINIILLYSYFLIIILNNSLIHAKSVKNIDILSTEQTFYSFRNLENSEILIIVYNNDIIGRKIVNDKYFYFPIENGNYRVNYNRIITVENNKIIKIKNHYSNFLLNSAILNDEFYAENNIECNKLKFYVAKKLYIEQQNPFGVYYGIYDPNYFGFLKLIIFFNKQQGKKKEYHNNSEKMTALDKILTLLDDNQNNNIQNNENIITINSIPIDYIKENLDSLIAFIISENNEISCSIDKNYIIHRNIAKEMTKNDDKILLSKKKLIKKQNDIDAKLELFQNQINKKYDKLISYNSQILIQGIKDDINTSDLMFSLDKAKVIFFNDIVLKNDFYPINIINIAKSF